MEAAVDRQESLVWDPIAYLNERRGVIDSQDIQELWIPAYRRTNITLMAGAIGLHLAEQPDLPVDTPLAVTRPDLWRAHFQNLNRGLYIGPKDPRYQQSKNLRIAIQYSLPLTMYGQEGVQPHNVGVALGTGEYAVIATSPRRLAEAFMAKVMDAHSQDADREAARETARRGAGHILEDRIERLETFNQRFIDQRILLRSLYRDAYNVGRQSFLGRNLDNARRRGDELIHDIAETSMNSLNYGTNEINAVHRAIVHRLYRDGSTKDLALQWRLTTRWASDYINAKRGKVNQSLNGCLQELRVYQPHLDRMKQ